MPSLAWPTSDTTATARKLTRTSINFHSYNRYLAVAARVVRRSLKEDKRLAAERRGQQELRFAKWSVSVGSGKLGEKGALRCKPTRTRKG